MPSPSKKRQIARNTLKVVEDKKTGKKKVHEAISQETVMGAKVITYAERPDLKPEDVVAQESTPPTMEPCSAPFPQPVIPAPFVFPPLPFPAPLPETFPTVNPVPEPDMSDVEGEFSELDPFNPDMVAKAKLPKKAIKWQDVGPELDPAGFLADLPALIKEERTYEFEIDRFSALKSQVRDKIDTAFLVVQGVAGKEVAVGQYGASRIVPTKKGTRFDLDTFIMQLITWGVGADLINQARAAATFETEPGKPYIKIRSLVKADKDEKGEGEGD